MRVKSKPIASTRRPIQTVEPGFTLHKLNPDDFHEAVGLVERVKTCPPDAHSYIEPMNRDYWAAGCSVITADGKKGSIAGFAIDGDTLKVTPFARVNGRLYHVSTLRRAW